jgi:hypothetical protein
MLLPWVMGIGALAVLPWTFAPAMVGAALLATVLYRFPLTAPKKSTLLSELRNPYASPVRGIPVSFAGKVMGRGTPGYVLGEDMCFADITGLIYLDYVSGWGIVGDWVFAWRKVKQLMGIDAQATGWFFRGLSSSMTLADLETTAEKVRSHPRLWGMTGALLLMVLSIGLWAL